MIIETKIIPSDYKGDRLDPSDCPGHRAFKRACRENLPWYRRIFMNYHWCNYESFNSFGDIGKWKSLDENGKYIPMQTRFYENGTVIQFTNQKIDLDA